MPKPKFKRFFEKLKLSNSVKVYYLCAGLVLITLSLFNLAAYTTINKTSYVLGETSFNEEKISYWESFLEVYPDYKDGWIKLAQLYYHKGDVHGVEDALDRLTEIDPNSEEIKSLKFSLGL